MKLAVPVSPVRRDFAPIPLQGDLPWAFDQAHRAGYQGVELHIGHPRELEQFDVPALLRDSGLAAVSIATGLAYVDDGLCLSQPDPAKRLAAVQRVSSYCHFAAEMRAAVGIGLMRGGLSVDPLEADAQRNAFVESLGECADAAAGLGVTILLEPINRYETNYLPTVAAALEVLDSNGLHNVQLLLDTFHMNIEEISIELAIAHATGRIGLLQLVDTNRCAPGMGHLDVRTIVATLQAGGYDGFLSIEALPIPTGPEAIQRAATYLRELIPTLGDCSSKELVQP
jgi:sugar phosphate isomerase/epimerase